MLKLPKKSIIFASLAIGLSILGYSWVLNQPFTEQISWFAQTHWYALIVILMLLKILGLVWPPFPGGIALLVAIPFIGWQQAFVIDLLGTSIGATLCYAIAKKWGYAVLAHIFDADTLEKIAATTVKENRQVEFGFAVTIASRLVMAEVAYYAAGILRINFWKFMLGAVGSHVLFTLPSYYFAERVLAQKNPYSLIVAIVVLVPLVLILKKRYLETRSTERYASP